MDFLTAVWMGKAVWMWLVFFGIVLGLLIFDLGVLNKKDHDIGVRESLLLSAFYIGLALCFGGWVWFEFGPQAGKEYLTGFLIEKTLALDNIFVISMIFAFFSIPRKYQHRVLFWGILGVVILRGIMIGVGAALVARFEWILLIFAVFLVGTGIKMLFTKDKDTDLSDNFLLKWLRKHLPVTETFHGHDFFVKLPDPKKPGKLKKFVTPLFLALILVEFADIIFAVDSIPAIFAITNDPYIIYTSNIFAILGLRALYFALAAIIHRFHYLKYSLAVVLIFIGGKVLAADFLGIEKIPAVISLSVTVILLASGICYSLWKSRGDANPVVVIPDKRA